MSARHQAALAGGGWRFVSDHVAVRRSRRFATTTSLIVAGTEAILVDPAWDVDELDLIARSLSDVQVIAGFATHAHFDHVLWHPGFGLVPRWGSPETAARAAARRAELTAEWRRTWAGPERPELLELVGRIEQLDIGDLPWSGPAVRMLVHDAHADGHTALWIPDDRVLLAGDMLSDEELPLPENGSLDAYAVGLAMLHSYALAAEMVVPGHGSPGGDAADRWRADSRYLDQLLAGLDPGDARRENAGMEHAHRRALDLARQ